MINTSVMNSRNAVCVIVHDKDADTIAAVLYGARNWSPQPAWTLPGGKAEPGEALDEAAARELKEETGLLVDPADLALAHVIHVEQGWDQAGQFVLFVFATDTWTGELTNTEPDKHLAAEWVAASGLPTPAFPTSTQALAAYRDGSPSFSRHGWSVTAAQ
ncbi:MULTISPECIES: NUDIX domain-containing protein [unclassified Streptomyces]|uniref:NUDIX domain-containing protein n=1 Tax=unclassified Streptomyces TaxID=2593676 RepID=UPI000F6C5719|nr:MULTISPECIES: NUDIX domain-containing protein [unclassified Streptomyces]AZM61315.1 DNA mismatch repair protein MutT [Streptomyces sp. WAC 01438]RSM89194.1 DNA mismatch repair protein MutT [Streptomyces sp. WAC 01420]